MKTIDNNTFKNSGRISDLFNNQKFIHRVASCLIEDGYDINFGDYLSKSYIHGHIKVLKSLNLYNVKGRGLNKKITVNDKLHLIILSTISDEETIAKTIISLSNGDYIGVVFGSINTDNYNNLVVDIINNPLANYNTYLFINNDCGLIKIGRSKDVFKRLYSVQSEIGSKNISIIAYKILDIESELHIKYRMYRRYGEWFDLDMDTILDIINEEKFEHIISLSK